MNITHNGSKVLLAERRGTFMPKNLFRRAEEATVRAKEAAKERVQSFSNRALRQLTRYEGPWAIRIQKDAVTVNGEIPETMAGMHDVGMLVDEVRQSAVMSGLLANGLAIHVSKGRDGHVVFDCHPVGASR